MEKIKHELGLLPMVLGSESQLRADGRGPLIMRISLNGKPEQLSLSTNVFPENWLVDEKKVSKNEENYKLINQKIEAAKVDLRRTYDKLFLEYDKVTPLMIKRAYEGKPVIEPTKKEKEKFTLMQAFDQFLLETPNDRY